MAFPGLKAGLGGAARRPALKGIRTVPAVLQHGSPKVPSRRFSGGIAKTAALIASVVCLTGTASAQMRPRLEVGIRERQDGPPDAVVTLHHLLADDRFLSAMRSGFPLYMAYQLELRESRSMWDRVVSSEAWELVVLYDPGRDVYRLEDSQGTEEIRDRAVLERRLSAAYVFEGHRADGPGHFHFRGSVAARTLSDEDVDEVFAWLRGESGGAPRRPGLVTRTARKLLIQVAPLPRLTLEARSPDFAGR